MNIPMVDLGDCTLCEGCIVVCAEVFSLNPAGYIEVADLVSYPEEDVEEAMKLCPVSCIHWEDSL